MTKELKTTDYMINGWDRGPIGCHPYKRGSRHNKLGMSLTWIFYLVVSYRIIYTFYVLTTKGGTN
jgi:hypothetical protein